QEGHRDQVDVRGDLDAAVGQEIVDQGPHDDAERHGEHDVAGELVGHATTFSPVAGSQKYDPGRGGWLAYSRWAAVRDQRAISRVGVRTAFSTAAVRGPRNLVSLWRSAVPSTTRSKRPPRSVRRMTA